MNPPNRTPFDFTEDAASRRDLGVPCGDAPRKKRRRRRNGTAQRLMASAVVLVMAAAMAGLATYATFTSSTSASHSSSTGTVTVNLGATGGTSNRLNVAVTGMAPTDTAQRTVDVINTSSMALASTKLTTSATTSSLLDTDATNGLQMTIDKCSVPWTEAGTAPAYTYTCGGTTTSVLASRAVIGSNIALSNMALSAGGGTDRLRITLTLPTTAGNTFQGITSTINFQFTGTQRAGTNV